ncbi:hypothetical protein CSOJ01_03386 [Colletotrichum sojae]|uniref:Uncharacterized protein n=1 Tax=Colletotrichum sojae TaxID=2175907 RepID=A0A8H6JN15_9PEZI|nr:hypothetical protein CSOJ01_03386 [Colletotrichum sojae]
MAMSMAQDAGAGSGGECCGQPARDRQARPVVRCNVRDEKAETRIPSKNNETSWHGGVRYPLASLSQVSYAVRDGNARDDARNTFAQIGGGGGGVGGSGMASVVNCWLWFCGGGGGGGGVVVMVMEERAAASSHLRQWTVAGGRALSGSPARSSLRAGPTQDAKPVGVLGTHGAGVLGRGSCVPGALPSTDWYLDAYLLTQIVPQLLASEREFTQFRHSVQTGQQHFDPKEPPRSRSSPPFMRGRPPLLFSYRAVGAQFPWLRFMSSLSWIVCRTPLLTRHNIFGKQPQPQPPTREGHARAHIL